MEQEDKSNIDNNLIADFIHNRLNDKELANFNRKIQQDKSFAQKLAFISALKIGVKDGKLDKVELKEKLLKKAAQNRRRKLLKYLIGFLITAAVLFAFYWRLKSHQLKTEEIEQLRMAFKEQIRKEYDIKIAGNEKNTTGPILIYNNQIREGLELMNNNLQSSSGNKEPTAYYYGASLLLFDNNLPDAIKYLEMATSENSDYEKDAFYYLVITYTLNKQYALAKAILQKQPLDDKVFPETILELLN